MKKVTANGQVHILEVCHKYSCETEIHVFSSWAKAKRALIALGKEFGMEPYVTDEGEVREHLYFPINDDDCEYISLCVHAHKIR